MKSVTVFETLDGQTERRTFELDPEIHGDIETAKDYCSWANNIAGEIIFTTYDPNK